MVLLFNLTIEFILSYGVAVGEVMRNDMCSIELMYFGLVFKPLFSFPYLVSIHIHHFLLKFYLEFLPPKSNDCVHLSPGLDDSQP